MSNSYYNHSTFPVTGSAATSQSMRAELDLIAAGFDKLPGLTGNANKLVAINGTATGLTTIATSAQLAAAISDETGSGSLVFADSPTLTNPVITGGSYTPTTFVVPSGTGSTTEGVLQWSTSGDLLTIGTGAATKTFVDLDTSQTVTNKTFNLANNTLVATSAQLAAAITDETGTGSLVFATSPALAGTPTAPTAAAGTNTTQLATTAHVFAERSNAFTLTNKTISGASNTLTNIGNSSLTNSSLTIGTTNIALGATSLTLAGLTSVAATTFTGALTGNASTATTLATTRTIWGQNFNGSANVTGALTSVTDITASGTLTSAQLNVLAQGDLRLEDASGGQYVALQAPATIASNFTLTLPDTAGASGQALITDGAGNLSWSTSASGDVYGPASATDNAVTRFDGTTGKLIQNSGVIIDDSNNVTGVVNLTSSGSVTLSGGTANGVAYLNGSKVLTTGSALTFDGTDFVLASGGLLDVDSTNAAVAMRIRQTTAGTGTEFNTTITENTGVTFDSSDSGGATARSFVWTTAGTEQMRLTSTGLGIGTSSPDNKVTLWTGGAATNGGYGIGRTATEGGLFVSGGNNMYIGGSAAGDIILRSSSENLIVGTSAAKNLYLATNNAIKMTLDSSGNLGLGVTPSAWRSNEKVLQLPDGAFYTGSNYVAVGQNYYIPTGGGALYIESNYASDYYQVTGQHIWRTAASGTAGATITWTQAMTLNASGNLGVGTSSPNAKLELLSATSGNFEAVRLTNNAAPSAGVLTDSITIQPTFNNNAGGYADAGKILFGKDGDYTTTANRDSFMAFYTTLNNATTERMRIDSSGNLGLGVTPSAWNTGNSIRAMEFSGGSIFSYSTSEIDVVENAYYDAVGWKYKNTNLASKYTQYQGGHSWYTAPSGTAGAAISFTQAMTLDASGNLNLGLTSGTARASVVGGALSTNNGVSISNGLTNGRLITGSGNVNSIHTYYGNEFLEVSVGSSHIVGTVYDGTYASPNMRFFTDSTERMRLDASGNLLVGTTANTNSSKLVVNGTISETVGGTQYLVLSQADIGTAPNEVPVNGMLGKLAFEDVLDTVTNNPYNDTAISDVQPSLLLDFANAKTLDPRVTFTRSTTATYYNGVTTAMAEQNLIPSSQYFTNSFWQTQFGTTTANTVTAPDGTSTGSTYLASNTTGYHTIGPATYVGYSAGTYTFSVYLKNLTATYAILSSSFGTGSWASAVVDLSTGTITQTSASGTFSYISSSISAVGSWYRISLTFSTTSTSIGVGVGISNSGTPTISGYGQVSYLAAGTESIYLWGAQFEQRSAVTAYTPTTSAAITNYIPVMQTAAAGVPRFDCNPVTGESLGLLIEEQRTNLFTYSSQFDNAAWSKSNSTVDANTIVAPDGTLTGDKIIATATTGDHYAYVSAVSVTGPYTLSVCAKAGESSFLAVYTGGNWTWFNLAAGVLGTVATSQTGNIQAIGNGWYRCSVSVPSGSYSFHAIGVATSNGASSSTGNGYSGLYIWGAQLEAGSFATSYIATTSSSATRNADNASMTGTNFSSWYNQAEGTLYSGAIANSPSSSTGGGYSQAAAALFQDVNNYIELYRTSTSFGGYVNTLGSGVASFSTSGFIQGTLGQYAISYKSNDFGFTANGSGVSTDTSGAVPTVSGLYIGCVSGSGGFLNGTIKKLAYYPKRLSDAELMEMTE